MDKNTCIVVTGAAGFIGSCLVGYLNEKGFRKLILVDDFTRKDKSANLEGKEFLTRVNRENFFQWAGKEKPPVHFVFHLGARTDTTEFDYSILRHLNLEYSEKIWAYCTPHKIPLIYASSAATYGSGEFGYEDREDNLDRLEPLNAYGISKNEFDKWAIARKSLGAPPCWAGVKFFNVYGPNEYHKKRMASVMFHSFHQIRQTGRVRLFRSHRPEYRDGEQLRDFIYVKDLLDVLFWMMEAMLTEIPGRGKWQTKYNGLYNLGTGIARTFADLALAVFRGLDRVPDFDYIDMPPDIRDKYQYFTQAHMDKLRALGYDRSFYSLEAGVADYVRNFLVKNTFA
jgi:ADP-L-glycero-D-manno-heptose 6-epimerase